MGAWVHVLFLRHLLRTPQTWAVSVTSKAVVLVELASEAIWTCEGEDFTTESSRTVLCLREATQPHGVFEFKLSKTEYS